MTDAQLQTAITNIADGSPNTASEVRAILNEFYLRTPKSNSVIIKDVTNQYIADNFDGTGLGINLETGYAIVNGNNGTRNWAGRVPLAYGTGYTTMGASLGSKDAVLVEHTHTFTGSDDDTGDNGDYIIVSPSNSVGTKSTLSTQGVSGTDKNIQPSIITLFLMKL